MAQKSLHISGANGAEKTVSVLDTATVREILQQFEEDEVQDREAKLIRGVTLLEPDMTVNEAGLEDGDELSLVWSPLPLFEMACWRGEEMDQDVCVQIQHHTRFIDDEAFRNCTCLKKVKFPGTVESIGHEAFYGCSSLTQVEFSDCLTYIGEFAFAACPSLTKVKIPNSVTSVGDGAFEHCSSLTQVDIPSSVTNIGAFTFAGCSSLTHLEIPGSVARIGPWAFKDCPNLELVLPRNSWIHFPPRELGCWFRRAEGVERLH